MKIGWNLGNTLDAHNNMRPRETAWGNPLTTPGLMKAVADYGFCAVRVPVTWGNMIGPAPDYTINPVWMSRVAEVVEYVHDAGMKAIINIHHDGADSYYWLSVRPEDLFGQNKIDIDAKFTAVWRQIAERFRNIGDNLIFEAFNELHDGSWGNGTPVQHSRVNELNQIFVDTVRAVGGENTNRYLVIPGWVTRPSVTVSALVLPIDPAPEKLIVAIHYYDPYDFTGSARQNVWGSNSHSDGWANETHMVNTFEAVRDRFITKGIPVILGEYGAVNQRTAEAKAYRRYYMEFITKLSHDLSIIPFYWDNGGIGEGSEKFALIDRYYPYELVRDAAPIMEAMMRAVNEDYLLSDITPP
jgi:aryl-phospho-beta-D-glucosidase BglC (GH1 family)